MAKHLRLLEIAPGGYLVACLAGLLDPDRLRLAFNNANLDAVNVLFAQDTFRAALRPLEFIAWKQGVASWGANHRPLDHVGSIPFFASE